MSSGPLGAIGMQWPQHLYPKGLLIHDILHYICNWNCQWTMKGPLTLLYCLREVSWRIKADIKW